MEIVVVTRHKALVEYLIERAVVELGVTVIEHATAEDIRGKHVYGVLPLHLAACAALVTEVPMNIPADMRGRELTLDEVRRFAGPARTYAVTCQDD